MSQTRRFTNWLVDSGTAPREMWKAEYRAIWLPAAPAAAPQSTLREVPPAQEAHLVDAWEAIVGRDHVGTYGTTSSDTSRTRNS